jgi:hypothetical protein
MGRNFAAHSPPPENTMDPDTPASNPNDPQGQRPDEEEKKIGEHGQIGNLQDPAQDQASEAQLNQGQGNQGQQSRDSSQIEISQDQETSESDEDVFSDEASNDPPQRSKVVDGGNI